MLNPILESLMSMNLKNFSVVLVSSISSDHISWLFYMLGKGLEPLKSVSAM